MVKDKVRFLLNKNVKFNFNRFPHLWKIKIVASLRMTRKSHFISKNKKILVIRQYLCNKMYKEVNVIVINGSNGWNKCVVNCKKEYLYCVHRRQQVKFLTQVLYTSTEKKNNFAMCGHCLAAIHRTSHVHAVIFRFCGIRRSAKNIKSWVKLNVPSPKVLQRFLEQREKFRHAVCERFITPVQVQLSVWFAEKILSVSHRNYIWFQGAHPCKKDRGAHRKFPKEPLRGNKILFYGRGLIIISELILSGVSVSGKFFERNVFNKAD